MINKVDRIRMNNNLITEMAGVDSNGTACRIYHFSNGIFSCHIMQDAEGELWFAATETALHLNYGSPRTAVRKYTRLIDRQVINVKTPTGWRKMNYINSIGLELLKYFQRESFYFRKYTLWLEEPITSLDEEYYARFILDEGMPETYYILNELSRQNGWKLRKVTFVADLDYPIIEYVEDTGLPLSEYVNDEDWENFYE